MTEPDELVDAFLSAAKGQAAADPYDILWGIIDDILDSVRLAVTAAVDSPAVQREIIDTVTDYVTNHYGED